MGLACGFALRGCVKDGLCLKGDAVTESFALYRQIYTAALQDR
jgi:hypothetical protein